MRTMFSEADDGNPAPSTTGANTDGELKRVLDLYKKEKGSRQSRSDIWEENYDYVLHIRESFFG